MSSDRLLEIADAIMNKTFDPIQHILMLRKNRKTGTIRASWWNDPETFHPKEWDHFATVDITVFINRILNEAYSGRNDVIKGRNIVKIIKSSFPELSPPLFSDS